MTDLTVQTLALRCLALLLVAGVHGGALTAAASLLGDPGPRQDGRLGGGPLRHLDLLGGVLAVVFGLGWIRPVAVDPARLRPGRAGLVLVVLAAAAATLALAAILLAVRPALLNALPDTAAAASFVLIDTVARLCLGFTVFNLLPLPPLTGQHLLVAVLPGRAGLLRRAQPYGAGLLALAVASGAAARWLDPAVRALASGFGALG